MKTEPLTAELLLHEYLISELLINTSIGAHLNVIETQLAALDQLGFAAFEVANKDTFKAALALKINPWQQLHQLKSAMPKTAFQMSVSGQYLFAERQFSDDVVFKFVECAVAAGVDIFNISDPLNDPQNMRALIQAAKAHNKQVMVTLHYTDMAVASYLRIANQLDFLGVDSVAILNHGQLKPYQAYDLVLKIKTVTKLPCHLHTRTTNAMASATILKAVEASLDGVSSCVTWQPGCCDLVATQLIQQLLSRTNKALHIKLKQVTKSIEELLTFIPRSETAISPIAATNIQQFYQVLSASQYTQLLSHNISHEIAYKVYQLLEKKDRQTIFFSVLDRVQQIQNDLGMLPLQPPVDAVVINQAIDSISADQPYQVTSVLFKQLCIGYYGQVTPRDERLINLLQSEPSKIQGRFADSLEPEYGVYFSKLNAHAEIDGLQLSNDKLNITQEIVTYAMYGDSAFSLLSKIDRQHSEQRQVEQHSSARAATAMESAPATLNLSTKQTMPEARAQELPISTVKQDKNAKQQFVEEALMEQQLSLDDLEKVSDDNEHKISITEEKKLSNNTTPSTQQQTLDNAETVTADSESKQLVSSVQQQKSSSDCADPKQALRDEFSSSDTSSSDLLMPETKTARDVDDPSAADLEFESDGDIEASSISDDDTMDTINSQSQDEQSSHLSPSSGAARLYGLKSKLLALIGKAGDVQEAKVEDMLSPDTEFDQRLHSTQTEEVSHQAEQAADSKYKKAAPAPVVDLSQTLYQVARGKRSYLIQINPEDKHQHASVISTTFGYTSAPKTKTTPALMTKVVAPMDGRVLELRVKNGQHINRNQCLLVLEILGQQTPLYATTDAKVSRIEVEQGVAVSLNQVLLYLN